ncbi:pyruvate ferredoxin oxidoreductase [bacterium BMS3Abin03]|nr:pyruvate ferredoxin oxidoreductase [bacterium BMS3Abin03]MCG6960513.1 pyruvate ferredoxin oxidoreductase [bacterium BMS3Abin03]
MNNDIHTKEILKPVSNSKQIVEKYPRHTLKIIKGNFAAAEAAKLCRVGFVPAYPITPQTSIVERLSSIVAAGELDARYVNMDSEHSVFAAAMGASLAGERVFTATSGQGLFYAHEVLHAIAHFRLPIVICNVGRPSLPWNIWSDQTDSISQRDTGWIQFYGESSQGVLDTIIQGYVISEKLDLPVMVVLDAFYQSHTSENVWVPDSDLVDEFLPPKKRNGNEIDLKNPKDYGGLVPPDHYETFNFQYWRDITKVEELTDEIGQKFGEYFGRKYSAIEAVNIGPKTKMILVALSTITSTARGVINNHPEVGLIKLRLFKPFPVKSILKAFENVPDDTIIINVERNFIGDKEGAIAHEMKHALYGKKNKMYDVYTGLGGKDVPPLTIEKIIEKGFKDPEEIIWIDFE